MKGDKYKEYYVKNKEIFAEKSKIYREKNKDKIKEKRKEYREKNRERLLLVNKENYKKRCSNIQKKEIKRTGRKIDKEKRKESVKKWRELNKGKASYYAAKRRAAKLQATPSWLTTEHLLEIKSLYIKAEEMSNQLGIKYHVDHIIPLQGKLVRGLHVPWNLQILEADKNISKGNRL